MKSAMHSTAGLREKASPTQQFTQEMICFQDPGEQPDVQFLEHRIHLHCEYVQNVCDCPL